MRRFLMFVAASIFALSSVVAVGATHNDPALCATLEVKIAALEDQIAEFGNQFGAEDALEVYQAVYDAHCN